MLCRKKIDTNEMNNNCEDTPIDFRWMAYIGMNKLGFTYREVMHMYFGLWADMYEAYKVQYNFETGRGLYEMRKQEKISSLSVL